MQTVFILVVVVIFLITIDSVKYMLKQRKENLRIQNETEEVLSQVTGMADIIQDIIDKENVVVEDKREDLFNNNKTLADLLNDKPEESGYVEVTKILKAAVQEAYKNYKFIYLKPNEDDYLAGYAIKFTFPTAKFPSLYEDIFKLTIGCNLKEKEINRRFSKLLASGDVIPIGDVTVDEDSTGMSQILTGEDLAIFVTFEDDEYIEKRKEAEAKQKEEQAKQESKRDKMNEAREEGYRKLVKASALLEVMSDKLVEEHPEFMDAYLNAKSMYE